MKLIKDEITPIIKKILIPSFGNAKENDQLYESITEKWWETIMKGSFLFKETTSMNFKYHMPNTICKLTKKAVRAIPHLNLQQREALRRKTIIDKFTFIHNTTGIISPNQFYIYKSPGLRQILRSFILILTPAFLMGFSYEMLGLLAVGILVSIFFSDKFINGDFFNGILRQKGYEMTPLTDYFISDKLLASVENILDKRLNDTTTLAKKNNLKKILPKRETRIVSDHDENLQNVTSSPSQDQIYQDTESNRAIRKLKKQLRTKRKERRKNVSNHLPIDSSLQISTWTVNNGHTLYKRNPLKQNSKVRSLTTEIESLKEFCKNKFVVYDPKLINKLVPSNPALANEFIRIFEEPKLVREFGQSGVKRYNETIEAKTIKHGFSHYRLLCDHYPKDDQGKDNALYLPNQLTNANQKK